MMFFSFINKKLLLPCAVGAILLGQVGIALSGVYDDLLKAIENNDTGEVTAILQRGMDVNTVDKSGNSLLMLAVQKDNIELVRYLLSHRARPGIRNQYGDTPLMLASLKGQTETVRLLVTAGAEINQAGWTALAYAAYEGHEEVVKYLIDKGADVDARAPNQATALMMAAKNGHIGTVRLLLDADADTGIEAPDGATALEWAKEAGWDQIVQMLRLAEKEER